MFFTIKSTAIIINATWINLLVFSKFFLEICMYAIHSRSKMHLVKLKKNIDLCGNHAKGRMVHTLLLNI
jgi:hypothetical protein